MFSQLAPYYNGAALSGGWNVAAGPSPDDYKALFSNEKFVLYLANKGITASQAVNVINQIRAYDNALLQGNGTGAKIIKDRFVRGDPELGKLWKGIRDRIHNTGSVYRVLTPQERQAKRTNVYANYKTRRQALLDAPWVGVSKRSWDPATNSYIRAYPNATFQGIGSRSYRRAMNSNWTYTPRTFEELVQANKDARAARYRSLLPTFSEWYVPESPASSVPASPLVPTSPDDAIQVPHPGETKRQRVEDEVM